MTIDNGDKINLSPFFCLSPPLSACSAVDMSMSY